ncbi:hypothetical protein [Promineifilum sp.]|uniref:hypothetical protein n=1 Tax=Promineifilum sp. TaxID=2664178 RepID=UPI0031CC7518
MLDGRWLEEYSAEYATPSVRQLAGKLFEESWRRAWKTSHDGDNNREVLRTILHNARLSPDLVDPPDLVLRLAYRLMRARSLRYERTRTNHSEYHPIAAEWLAVVHEALEAFAVARATVDRDEGSSSSPPTCVRLRSASRRYCPSSRLKCTSGDPVETEQPASVEVSA